MATPFQIPHDLTLEDDVALLRPLEASDLEHLIHFAEDENEREIWKYSSLPAIGRENFTAYIDMAIRNRYAGTEFPFVVIDKRTGEFAGCTRFYDIQPSHKSLQLGYTWYGTKFQRTGLNRHCKFLLLSFVFEQWGAARLEFRAHNGNIRSITAMKAIGCTVEGVLRNHMASPDGTRRDTIVLSILREEWFGRVKSHLSSLL